jgi:serine/threonine protein kinase
VDLPEGAREQVFVDLANAVKESLDRSERGDDVLSATGRAATPDARRPTPWPAAMHHSVPTGLTLWGKIDEESLGRIRLLEFMNSTGHSVLQKCELDGMLCVLKATRAELCDVNALAVLANGGPRPSPLGTAWNLDTMATPRGVWLHDDHVWELQEFYHGRSLAAIVEERQKPMVGAELSAVVNAIVDVLELLDGKGLVHRDINPSNVLMLDGRLEFRIVDWSFCCLASTKASPVRTPGYTAPEQERGAAQCASDWYSLGATCFALANGFTVHERGPAEFARGVKKIHLDNGEFRGWPEEAYFDGLLSENPTNRPEPWEGKNKLFSIARSSQEAVELPPAKSPFSWISRLLQSVRQR